MPVRFINIRMEKLLYREEQSFRQSFTIWILLAAYVLVLGIMGYGMYQQLYLGKPFGDNPESDTGLIWSGIIAFVVMNAVFLFMMSARLITEIWSDGIRYKFPPLIRKTRHIPLSEIKSADVERYNPIIEFGGWGWRRRLMSRKTAYNVSGRIGIRVLRNDGRQVMLGTREQDEMKRALARMKQQAGSDK